MSCIGSSPLQKPPPPPLLMGVELDMVYTKLLFSRRDGLHALSNIMSTFHRSDVYGISIDQHAACNSWLLGSNGKLGKLI